MQALLDFIRLNGYGVYVWPAFAFAAAVLAFMGLRVRARLRAAEELLKQLEGGSR
jgi:heme exporter protein D